MENKFSGFSEYFVLYITGYFISVFGCNCEQWRGEHANVSNESAAKSDDGFYTGK